MTSPKGSSPERAGASAKPRRKAPKLNKMAPPKKCRVVAICNQKGGCGKTTSVINIAATLAEMGQKVLVVDLDSQCNATTGLGIDADEVETSLFDLLVKPKKYHIADIVLETETENLHVAPSSIELAEFESRVAREIGRENRLKRALEPVLPHYDFILLDTPPSLGLLSVNALNAANEVFIAMQAHPFAFDGLELLLETINLVQQEINPTLSIKGIIVTMFDPRTKISREIMNKVNNIKDLKKSVFKTVIRQNIKLTEASKLRIPVMYYEHNCTGTRDYIKISREICSQHTTKNKNRSSTRRTQPNK